jgi:hypothetical protein
MKDLKFIQACPDDTYYTWQVNLWLESLRDIGHSDKAISLIFTPKGRAKNNKWKQIVDLYPEAEFYFYEDEDELSKLLGIYIPVLRPYVLWKHFKLHPELSEKAIFYCDSDILFMKDFNVDQFLEDDINYLSDTNSYINAKYFDSKINQVLPEKLEEYKTRDILAELCSIIGITREIAEKNNDHSGGAQYLLKNIDSNFWSKVMNDSILIRTYLQQVNREFFKDENTGFQSWCADMWAVLWNLWFREQETKVVPELAFAWSTDPMSKLDTHTILHNAGIVSETGNGYPAFYKGKYHQGSDPTKDLHLDVILNNEESQKYCTSFYAIKIKEIKQKYNLNY